MSNAGWGEIWNRALALLAAEPIQVRILTGLIAAFAVVMVLEGLRANFLPARPKSKPAKSVRVVDTVKPAKSEKSPTMEVKPATLAPFRPHVKVRMANPKVVKVNVKSTRPLRPKIRREGIAETPALMFTEENAPFSPLLPISK